MQNTVKSVHGLSLNLRVFLENAILEILSYFPKDQLKEDTPPPPPAVAGKNPQSRNVRNPPCRGRAGANFF